MIDWDSGDWGNRVTYAANGSWVVDKHGDDVTDQDYDYTRFLGERGQGVPLIAAVSTA